MTDYICDECLTVFSEGNILITEKDERTLICNDCFLIQFTQKEPNGQENGQGHQEA